jgi:glycosyltransferase involved in cell wall biosynthesis
MAQSERAPSLPARAGLPPMTILYHFRTQGTGAEGVHIAGVARAFEKLGHRVVFSSPTGVDPRRTAGANPFREKQKRTVLARLAAHAPGLVFELLEVAYNLAALLRNRALLTQEKCDLIYERHAFFLFSTALLASARRVPLVVEVNELAGDERVRATPWFGWLARWADRVTFRRARLIVVVSPHLQRRICALGVSAGKVLVLPNAVAAESLDAPADGSGIRRKHCAEDAVIFGFVGWFVPWHRLDRLIEQFAPLATENPRLRLMLVGDGPLREDLAALAVRLGLEEKVIFTGAVPHEQIAAHLAAMDAGIVPHSNAYRSPIKLFETMACGRAVLAPDTEPIALVIRHGENGLLFDPERPEDLRAQLARLAADPELCRRLGAQAREDVRARHTWQRNVEAVLEVLERR